MQPTIIIFLIILIVLEVLLVSRILIVRKRRKKAKIRKEQERAERRRKAEIQEKENEILEKENEILEKETQFREKENEFRRKEQKFQAKETEFRVKTAKFQAQATKLQEKETELREKETQIQEKETQIQKKETQIREKETQIREKETQIREKETELRANTAKYREKAAKVQERAVRVQERATRVKKKAEKLREKEDRLREKEAGSKAGKMIASEIKSALTGQPADVLLENKADSKTDEAGPGIDESLKQPEPGEDFLIGQELSEEMEKKPGVIADSREMLQEEPAYQDDEDKGSPVIRVKDVSMKFRIASVKTSGIKDYIIRGIKRQISRKELVALNHITFDVYKGEVLGVIGTNGSGKSTLLKIISGALLPTDGTVEVDKSKIQLLTIGTGFDVELTARENVYLNGAIIGYTKEFLDEHYQEIVKFAELEGFMDEQVKKFSSGMISRLGFAIATAGNAAEILILDEILAVGDEFFRQKSLARIKEMIHGGSTVILVSHSLGAVRENCTKVLWIEKGKQKMLGDPKTVCKAYRDYGNSRVNKQ